MKIGVGIYGVEFGNPDDEADGRVKPHNGAVYET